MKNVISLFLLCILQTGFSQNWQWSKKILDHDQTTYGHSSHLLKGNGCVYVYGSRPYDFYYNNDPLTDTVGSFLDAYSTNGSLLFSKHWKTSLYIQQIVYDGANNLYFSGVFYGSLTINGVSINSMGSSDGVTGQMDLNGNITWMKTYGGRGNDHALCLAYNKVSNIIYTGGQVTDTLYFDHTFYSANSQSGIIVQYNPAGQRVNCKLYDFTPNATNFYTANCAQKISISGAGEIFVLMDRDGQLWSSYPITSPLMGRYVMKMNNNLDTLWTTYIIGPSCYYGWSCDAMDVSAIGDPYVTSFCSGKYGGDGELYRLNGATGKISWNHSNSDGNYPSLFIDANTVYLVGNEGANGCPCPGNTVGYYVVKSFDVNNQVLGESRVNNIYFNSIICSGGEIYAVGQLERDSARIGPDILKLKDGPSFLSKLSTVNCQPVSITSSGVQDYTYQYVICPGGNISFSGGNAQGTFTWSNGATGPQTNVSSSGSYYLINTQPNGCVAYSLPAEVVENTNNDQPDLLMTTYDKDINRNTIIAGAYAYSPDIMQINLFKDMNGNPVKVGETKGKAIVYAAITDTVSDPNAGKIDYYVSTVDTCGNTSPLSKINSSIFLSLSKDLHNKNILNWNTSTIKAVSNFIIRAGPSPNSLQYITSVSPGTGTYTDVSNSSGHLYYCIEAVTFSFSLDGRLYQNSFSNIVNSQTTPVAVILKEEFLSVYPNPAQKQLLVNYKATLQGPMQVSVRNLLGELVFSGTLEETNGEYKKEIEMSEQPNGIYMLETSVADKRMSRKIIKE